MKWPCQRRHEIEEEALAEAQRDLEEARARWPHVEAAVETLRRHRERNHFAESIAAIYAGRDPRGR